MYAGTLGPNLGAERLPCLAPSASREILRRPDLSGLPKRTAQCVSQQTAEGIPFDVVRYGAIPALWIGERRIACSLEKAEVLFAIEEAT